jgi:orotate phosphoribosyltransferase-like protein
MDPNPNEILRILDEARRLQREGYTFDEILDILNVDELTYYRYQTDYGTLAADQLRRLCKLESENRRLRRAISELMLDKLELEERSWTLTQQPSEIANTL